MLEVKLNQSFPDPSQFKEDKEFMYAAMTASVFKKVITEILMIFEGSSHAVKEINKKKTKKTDPFKVGK